ncbi:similar to Lachancea thermotolerans KLTH0E00638g hypothetical protein [Maudiozyma saulgeensis]|uniref:Calcineurin-like phosphoesterase domain-containing protein n=1 Tax=Maudiozyma saulgeensis TaxID=1789683 RepID=A0A1X7RB78_9SACH|nr:similar to Lachancea thermotolerans KLTH0E00638g hypothetical protein [Kazachstania saulgeensis]
MKNFVYLIINLLLGCNVVLALPFWKRVVTLNVNQSDEEIVQNIIMQLNETLKNKDRCSGCIDRLQIGKNLAIQKPDLVPNAFTEWCIVSGQGSNYSCTLTYGKSTVTGSSTGSNIADMLSLINPSGYDGQLYCHYMENGKCPKPQTPVIDISNMWPPKAKEHMVAPLPSFNDTFNVLHFSDFHIELNYTVGAEANCTTTTMCCSIHSSNKAKHNGASTKDGHWNSFYDSTYNDDLTFLKGPYIDVFKNTNIWVPATSFGNYQCDSPELLINSSLNSAIKYAKQNELDVQFTIFTGDIIAHDESKYISLETAKESEEYIFRDMKTNLGNIPVYPVLGNHDTYPYGEIAPEQYGFANKFTWNENLTADLWQGYGWLNSSEAQYARKHYTGYSLETPLGLKVISLNSNVWLRQNHYAFINSTDPDNFGQFKFLIDELIQSESINQRVWIIAHIPPAVGGLPLPSNVFAQIVERFSPSTIAGIFFGHTHEDQFQVMYAGPGNNSKTIDNVINSAWIAQSVTPFVGLNPSWKYYEVDRKTFSIMNAHNFYTNLDSTYSNNGEEPKWLYEYSARTAYNITWPLEWPLNATYWHLVAQSINSSVVAKQTYKNYSRRLSPSTPDCSKSNRCNSDFCFVSTFTVDEYDDCIAALGKNS